MFISEAEGLDIEGDSHHVTGTQENESVNTYYGEDAEPGQVQVRLVPIIDRSCRFSLFTFQLQ